MINIIALAYKIFIATGTSSGIGRETSCVFAFVGK